MHNSLLSTLISESCRDVYPCPFNIYLAIIDIPTDRQDSVLNFLVIFLAILLHLQYKTTAESWVISISKVLLNSSLERLNALADLL